MKKSRAMYWAAATFAAVVSLTGCDAVVEAGKEAGSELLDAKVIQAGSQVVTKYLRSPSSFQLVSGKKVWEGVDDKGNPAYIVRVEFDAQNGFGAMIRACQLAAFSFTSDDQFEHRATESEACDALGFGEEHTIELVRDLNDFVPKGTAPSQAGSTAAETAAPAAAEPSEAAAPAARIDAPAQAATAASTYQELDSKKGSFGTVTVLKSEFSFFVRVNDKRMPTELETSQSVSFEKQWSYQNRDVYLMATSTGGNGCPAFYFFVTVEQGSATMTNEFGNCSDTPDVSENNGEITVSFAARTEGAPDEEIRFVNGRVTVKEGDTPERKISVDRMAL